MKYAVSVIILVFVSIGTFAQVSTLNNYTGIWTSSSSWTSGIQPSPLTASINDGITINGYITRVGDLSFANVNQANNLVVNDTLIVDGSVTFANKAANLIIPSGGLMIVFGDFTADNIIEVNNGGLLIVMGNMSFSNSPQDDYIDNGGGLYVDGTVNGNATADGIDLPIADLQTDGYTNIYDFVTSGGSIPLPVELISFTATSGDNEITLNWSTASELNNDHFSLERSRNGKDFETIVQIDGQGTSHERMDYNYIDLNPYLGLSYYRLSQTDYDGTKEIFPVISVFNTNHKNVEIYPNPVTNSLLNIKSAGNDHNEIIQLIFMDLKGKTIMKTQTQANSLGNLETNLQLDEKLKKGTYIFKLITSKGENVTKLQIE